MSIRILITGGTFDKEYDELSGQLFFKETHLHEMLKLGRCSVDLEVQTLFMMDSLDMQQEHRDTTATQCLQAKENRIVITHGTDTMVETGQYLSTIITKKTIVLTGAMVPYKFGSSDGLFNLGSALAFVQTLQNGVYIAMNGKHFRAGQVRKNKQRGLFEPLK